jgi:hypothetical protein
MENNTINGDATPVQYTFDLEFIQARVKFLLKDWSHNIKNLDSITRYVLENIVEDDILASLEAALREKEHEIKKGKSKIVIPNIVGRISNWLTTGKSY